METYTEVLSNPQIPCATFQTEKARVLALWGTWAWCCLLPKGCCWFTKRRRPDTSTKESKRELQHSDSSNSPLSDVWIEYSSTGQWHQKKYNHMDSSACITNTAEKHALYRQESLQCTPRTINAEFQTKSSMEPKAKRARLRVLSAQSSKALIQQ